MRAQRTLIGTLREENAALTEQVNAERANGASLEKSYSAAQREITANERAIKALETAVKLHEQSVALLQSDRAALTQEVKKQKKRALVATLIAVGSIAIRLL